MKKAFSIFFISAIACTAGNAMLSPANPLSSEEITALSTLAQDTTKKKVSSRSNVYIVNDSKDKGNYVYINTDEGKRIELTYKGKIALTEDSKDIKSISPGGSLKYVQTVNDFTRRIEMKSDANGTITRTYSVNGKETAYEPAGKAWLQSSMPDIIIKTGIGLEAMVQDVYKKSGVKGVLAEAEKTNDSNSKLKVTRYLLEQPNLSASDIKSALAYAGSNSSSDYELGKILKLIPTSRLAKDDMALVYLQSAQKISSDYEKRKALSHLLSVSSLSNNTTTAAVKALSSISSDYEKGKLIQQLADQQNFLASNYKATFEVIDAISSDYEKGKSINTILSKQKLTEAQYQALFPVVSHISSDYEKGKVLRNIAPRIPDDATALREDYRKTAKTIGSDYEYRKAIEALK